MPQTIENIDILKKTADTIRCLAMDGVQNANSGHPGMPMGCADFAALLWGKVLKHDPEDPSWPDRDRFVLSPGHGSMLLYSVLHLAGYGISIDDLKKFRQWGSITPGHPEVGATPGVETTTGPLGQGFANGVGMAVAEAMLAKRFNLNGLDLVDHFTYGIVSDGDLMEGVAAEAASLAGHLRLGKLIYFYDSNRITIDGSTDLAYSDDVAARFAGYNWHVLEVDGHDIAAMEQALAEAGREKSKPSLIIGATHIAKGSPNKQDSSGSHGAPLGIDEIKLTKEHLGVPADKTFHVPPEVYSFFKERRTHLAARSSEWKARMGEMEKGNPDLYSKWSAFMERRLPPDLDDLVGGFDGQKPVATRNASGVILNRVAPAIENLVGGSADLAPSNKTFLNGFDAVGPGAFSGRNFHFGIREHCMGSMMNGMALHGGFIPYGGTFLVFSDYMRPAMRMAALSGLPIIYVFTHDSIFVGEDGPTHQPVEHVASLRAIPGLCVIRPADARETAAAWKVALKRDRGPTALILSRQGLPLLAGIRDAGSRVDLGAYCIKEESGGDAGLVLIATGSEVHLAMEAAQELENEGVGVRVVSMPSQELFEAQPGNYREEVIPSSCRKRLVVEAGISQGWDRYAGDEGKVLGMDRFGASAPYNVLAEKFGFTKENVLEAARSML